MSIYATQGGLAKLLATENINLRHVPGIKTAYFDLQSRTVNLPVWKGISKFLYDMLLVHETGHALHTNGKDWANAIDTISAKYYKASGLQKEASTSVAHFLNVFEDARIDRLQKIRYPGSKIDYIKGFQELHDRDFFGIKGKDLNKLSFIDRANLYCKNGRTLGIQFNDEEQIFIDRMEKTQTFSDVIALTDEVFAYCKKKGELNVEKLPEIEIFVKGKSQQKDKNDKSKDKSEDDDSGKSKSKAKADKDDAKDEDDSKGGSSDDEGDEDGDDESVGTGNEDGDEGDEGDETEAKGKSDDDADDEASASEGDDEGEESGSVTNALKGGEGSGTFIPVVLTQIAADKAMENMVSGTAEQVVYVELPTYNHDAVVDDYKSILNNINSFKKGITPAQWAAMSRDLEKIRKEENDSILYMVKEFERRKAAQLYARAAVAKTGVLDTNKIHGYSFREDLFKRNTTIPEGKNHGFVMLLDWSGSMDGYMRQTLIQLFNLVWFCKRIQVPFDVYTFRNLNGLDKTGRSGIQSNAHKPNTIVASNIKLRNVLSSRMNVNELKLAMEYLLGIVHLRGQMTYDSLSGTPLNAAVLALDKVINDFKKKYRTQVVNTIVLTDGESDHFALNNQYGSSGSYSSGCTYVITDPVTKNTHIFKGGLGMEATKTFIQILKDRTNTNTIGFYVLPEMNLQYVADRFGKDLATEASKKLWKEQGFATTTQYAYHEYHMINFDFMDRTNKNKSAAIHVTSDADTDELSKAFGSFLEKKKVAKVLLNRFVERISKEMV